VLQGTAAANAEVRAARFDPVRGCDQHLQRLRLVETALAPGLLLHHGFAGQRTGDEYGLARLRIAFGAARDAAAIVADVEDVEPERRQVESGHGNGCCGWPGIVAEGE